MLRRAAAAHGATRPSLPSANLVPLCRLQEQLKTTPVDGTIEEKMLAYERANRTVAVLCNHQVGPRGLLLPAALASSPRFFYVTLTVFPPLLPPPSSAPCPRRTTTSSSGWTMS